MRVRSVDQDAEAQHRALQRHGCHLVSLSEAIDTSTRAVRLVLVLSAALTDLEADLARERTRLAAQLALEWGSCGGADRRSTMPGTSGACRAYCATGG